MARDLKLEVLLQAIDKVTAPLRSITKGSGDAAKAFKASRDQLKELNQQQRDVGAFKTLQQELSGNAKALDDARAKITAYQGALERQRTVQQGIAAEVKVHRAAVRNLHKAMISAKEPSAELNRQYALAKDHLQKLEATYGKSNSQLRQLKRELKDAGTATANLNSKNQGLSERLTTAREKLSKAGIAVDALDDQERSLTERIDSTTASLKRQEEQLKRVTAQQERMAKAKQSYRKTQELAGNMAMGGAAAMANAYALSRPLLAAVGAFAPAEDAATQLKVSMMDAGGQVAEDFTRISELARSLGDRLPGTTAEFQTMMTMLLKQGISAKSVLGGTGEAAAYLGVQLKLPAEQAAEFAANMQDATGTVEADMMGLMDMIQKTANLGVNPDDIIQGFSKMSPAMTLIGEKGLKTSKAMAPLLAMMTQTGMAGESAGNAIRKVFQSGLDMDKVGKANKGLKKLGINLDFTNGKGDFGGLDHLFGQLEKLKGLNDTAFTETVKEIFGDDAETLQVVKTMMDKGLSGYNDVAGKMQAQADLRMRVNEQLQTLTNVMDAASGSWTNALAEFGAAVAPELKKIIQAAGAMANRIGAWARENPKLAATLIKVTAGIAALSAAGGALAIGIAGLLGPFAMVRLAMFTFGIKALPLLGLLPKLGLAIKAVGSALWVLAANPVALTIAAVAAAIGLAAYLIWKNWDTLGPKFAALWAGIKDTFSSTMDWFSSLPSRFYQFGADILHGLANGITSALGSVKTAITGAGEQTIGWFKEKLGIHSPSRVFAELGGFTMQGLEQGLLAGQGGPLGAVMGMGKQLAAAGAVALGMGAGSAMAVDSRPPLSAGTGAAPMVVQGDTISITIQAAPGTDTAGLRQMLNQLLDERERGKAARMRSALYDRE